MAGELDSDTIAKAYAGWAPVYDLVFGAVFDAGRKATIAAAERIGGRTLRGAPGPARALSPHPPPPRVLGAPLSRTRLRPARAPPPPRPPAHRHPPRGGGAH